MPELKFTNDELGLVIDAVDMWRDTATDTISDLQGEEREDQIEYVEALQGILNKLNNALLVPELTVRTVITSEGLQDADDIPMLDDGVFRYWGAFEDSPVPHHRVFVIFNREPVSEEEAEAAARAWFGDWDD